MDITSLIKDYQAGTSTKDLVGKYNIHRRDIYTILKKNGICSNRIPDVASHTTEVIADYQSGLSRKEICTKYKCSDAALHKLLKRNNITSDRYKKLTIEQESELLLDYKNGMSILDIQKKYSCIQSVIHRLIKRRGLDFRRDFTDYGDEIEFKQNYLSKSRDELESIYKTSFNLIRGKASRLGITEYKKRRPSIKRSMGQEVLYKEYIENNLTAQKISEKYKQRGAPSRGSSVGRLLIKYGIKKDSDLIKIQIAETRVKNYGSLIGPFGVTENKIRTWLSTFGFEFISDSKILRGKQIDLLNKELKLGIEYCGLPWHCEKVGKTINYHNNKRKGAEKRDIRLITIFEDEWIHRQDQVKSFLKSVIGKNSRKIAARKCEVREIDKPTACEFIEKYHIQGEHIQCNYQAGLFYQDELVGVMTLSPHHRDKTIPILDRLCFKEDVTVQGGANRLFKKCIEHCKSMGINKLISWSDNRWSQGKVYQKMGFILEEELKPDYSYVNLKKRYTRLSKQSQQKKKTGCPKGMTEKEFAESKKLSRIWDCGKKRWVFNIAGV